MEIEKEMVPQDDIITKKENGYTEFVFPATFSVGKPRELIMNIRCPMCKHEVM
jgi:hypothetical protein